MPATATLLPFLLPREVSRDVPAYLISKRSLAFLAWVLLLLAAGSPAAIALRIPGSPSTHEEIVACSQWIFAGRVTRVEVLQENNNGFSSLFLTVLPGLNLRGVPHKTVRLYVLTRQPIVAGSLYIFFANPILHDENSLLNTAVIDIQPYSTPLVTQTKARIVQHPYRKPAPVSENPLQPPQFR